jgi:poly(glycerol-phosphate) alpha-glucosyltransferase
LPLSRELSKIPGIDVELIGFDAPEPHFAHDATVCRPMPLPGFPVSLKMTKVLIGGAFDIVHTHGLWSFASIAALNWHLLTAGPTIVSPHGMLDTWAMGNSSWKKRVALAAFERAHLESARIIHALNEGEATAIRALGLTSPIAVIPSGVHMCRQPAAYPRPGFLTNDDRRVLLFLGRIHPKKGIHALIKAWLRVIRERPALREEWRLVIAGWDDRQFFPFLDRLVSELGLERHVHFVGPVFDEIKVSTFHHSHAFILPSLSEGLPMAVLEAWACGLPVFMTTNCNLPEGFGAGAAFRIGIEPEEIAGPLVELLPQTDLLARAGMAGRELARSNFSWAKVARDWNDVHQWVLEGGVKPHCLN